ncbi:MAG: hypothetical protein ABH822_01810 [Patescibacteria group bacterium]
MRKIIITIILVVALLLIGLELAAAQSSWVDIVGYGWSETIGWIKLNGVSYGMRLNPDSENFSGYSWSENIGWVDFDGVDLNSSNQLVGKARVCAGAVNSATCSGGVSPLSGDWDGWLSMSGDNYGVKMVRDPSEPCPLEGWAWGSDVVGWVRFSPDYCDYTPPPAEGISCDFSASPSWLLYPRSYTTLWWSCEGADVCRISGVGSVDPESGSTGVSVTRTTSFTLSCDNEDGEAFSKMIEVKVYDPVYCEIIPSGPGCP